jgi:hypothetical protein
MVQSWVNGDSAAEEMEAHLGECASCRFLVLVLTDTPTEPTTADEPILERGATVGRHLVLDILGRGGMGVVYTAYAPELDRRVALKLIRPDKAYVGSDVAAQRARLLREAQAMARLSHPNVLPVYDAGTIDERVFIAMQLVNGSTLTKWLMQPRDWRKLLRVLLAAGRGLQAGGGAPAITARAWQAALARSARRRSFP